MIKYIKFIQLLFITSWIFVQDCPPLDTLSIEPIQNSWDIPSNNHWNKIEVMTWNIKNFPVSNNTIDYVNEIITDILPDIIAFQEINNPTAFLSLANSIPAYEFISSGSGLALGIRSDVIDIISWTTLFPEADFEFVWRNPLLVELNWHCGTFASSIQIINIHLKAGSSIEDFNRREAACQFLSEYVNENPNKNIIILGDYNDEINDPENSNSLWPLVSNDALAFATEPIADNDYFASFPSWPSFLDHIALSTPLFDELNAGEITTIRIDDFTGWSTFQFDISDHRPVLFSFPIEEIELINGLVINEIMQNPAVVSDAAGEWIEIFNTSNEFINLHGLSLIDLGGEMHVISDESLVISPQGFLVLGPNDDLNLNGGVTINYQYENFTLTNNWDQIILSHPSGIIIDEVHYDNGNSFPDENGKSMMLLNPTLNNADGSNWISADVMFGSGDYGTPGSTNFIDNCYDPMGDLNLDGELNILDIVSLVNCIFMNNCVCNGDLNSDNEFNVLDIVSLVNCILSNNCQ